MTTRRKYRVSILAEMTKVRRQEGTAMEGGEKEKQCTSHSQALLDTLERMTTTRRDELQDDSL
jgi:hypothetical protein